MRRTAILLLCFGLIGCDTLDQGTGVYGSSTTYSGYGVNPVPVYYDQGYYYGQTYGPQTFYQPPPGPYYNQPYYNQPYYGGSDNDRYRQRHEWREQGDRRQFQQQQPAPTVLSPSTAPRAQMTPSSQPQPPSQPQPRSQLDNLGFRPNR